MGRFLRGLKSSEPVIDEFPLEPVELTEDEENYIENDEAAVNEALRRNAPIINNADALFGQAMTNMMSYAPVSSSLNEMEKKEWADRVSAMSADERAFILTRFSTEEIYKELGGRMKKDSKYIQDVKKVMNDYDKL